MYSHTAKGHTLTSAHRAWLTQWVDPGHESQLNGMLLAFTHPSYFGGDSEEGRRFERLEFFGDAAVNYFVTEELCCLFPQCAEGELARLKAALVSSVQLGKAAKALGMAELIYLGKGEQEQKNFLADKQLGKFFESLMGSFVLLFGFDKAKQAFHKMIKEFEQKVGQPFFDLRHLETFDAKSRLQNLCLQRWKELPSYTFKVERKDSQEYFTVELFVQGKKVGHAHSHSKKQAEKMAAEIALKQGIFHVN